MTGMDAQTLLACWEHGRRRHPLDRALLLFAAAEPHVDPETLADRPLGERNAALLNLRRELFGDELRSCVDCPECGERLEFTLSANLLLARAPARIAARGAQACRSRDSRCACPPPAISRASSLKRMTASAARKLLQRLCVAALREQWSDELEALHFARAR